MPARTPDTKGIWTYPTVAPTMDAQVNPHAVQHPKLVEATGVDGRFAGAIRPFPGMGDESIHGVPAPTVGVTTIETIENIIIAKYVSIQKGFSSYTIKGIAYIGDNQTGTGKSLYLAYRDSEDNSSDVVELEDFDSWDDFKVTSFDEVDITSLGRYIYLTVSGDTTSGVTQYNGVAPPYNKAYWWDFKINDWDKFVEGFDGRFMGLMPERLLLTPINEDNDGTYTQDSSEAFETQDHGVDAELNVNFPEGVYTYAMELVSRKHNLRSYLRLHAAEQPFASNSALRYFVDDMKLPASGAGQIQQILGVSTPLTCILHWGIPHVDGFRAWRTPGSDQDAAFDDYTLLRNLYLVESYLEKGVYDPDSSLLSLTFTHNNVDSDTRWFNDEGLLTQKQYNFFSDPFFPAPRMKRIQSYDGLLVGITHISEPESIDDKWGTWEQVPEAITWSSVVRPEPENFPPEQQYRTDDPSEIFLSLNPAGDHLFGVTNASIVRVSRSGSKVAINRLVYRIGGVSRWGQIGVGNALYIVTASGLKHVDGNTGALNSVRIMDRIILDDSEWASTLDSVHMGYDGKIGALIMLNTAKKEMFILWESTGALTRLEDVPWTFLATGPDTLTNGPTRAYFIKDDGVIHTIDGGREMGKRSMCGADSDHTVNGTAFLGIFDSETGLTTISSSGSHNFPDLCEGFKVYILTGDKTGESATIVERASNSSLVVSGLSGGLLSGDKFSVAPVVTRLVLPVAAGQGGQADPFVRKVIKTMSASFSDLGGETDSNDLYPFFDYGILEMRTERGRVAGSFNRVPDKTVGYLPCHTTRPFPFLEFKGGNQDWELQSVMVKGILSMSEAQSRQGEN